MVQVGVRELRQTASELLRRVALGETFEITDRGRPVSPVTGAGAKPVGTAAGHRLVEPATEDFDDLPEPLPSPAGAETPSAVLARLREDER